MNNMDVIDFIKKVGKGKTLSSHLSEEESHLAMEKIFLGEFKDSQLGAFLQAMRIQELDQYELNGFLKTCYEKTDSIISENRPSITINMSSDTPRKGGLLSLLAVGLLHKMGESIGVVHSTPVLSGNTESFNKSYEWSKFYFKKSFEVLECRDFLPALCKQDRVRGELGFRSYLHTLEKLMNPWGNGTILLGISHKKYAERMLRSLRYVGHRNARIILGNHGTVDLTLHKRTTCIDLLDKGEFEMQECEIFPTPEELKLKIPTSIYAISQLEYWDDYLKDSTHFIWNAVAYQAAFLLFSIRQMSGNQDKDEAPMVLYERCRSFIT